MTVAVGSVGHRAPASHSLWRPPSSGVVLPPPQLTLTQVAADNFNRANGPLAGSNGWLATGDGSAAIASNEASGVGAVIAADYRSTAVDGAYSGDQYAQAAVGSVNNIVNNFVGLTLRHNAATDADYACLYYINGSNPVLNLYFRLSLTTYTLIYSVGLAGALAPGTLIQFYVIGNVLVALAGGVQQIALLDNNIPSGGVPGLTTFGAMTLDNYQCGNASMGTPLGAAIGTDNFNRANGPASSGQPNWTAITATFSGVASTDGVIVSNELNVSDAGHHTAQRNEVYSADQWALLGVGSIPPTPGGSAFVGVILRWNGTQGYMFCYFLNVPIAYRIYFIHAGQASALLASCQAITATADPTGTVFTGVAKGSRLSIRMNNCEVIAVTDTQQAAGQPGYQIFPTTTADNFAAGNV